MRTNELNLDIAILTINFKEPITGFQICKAILPINNNLQEVVATAPRIYINEHW